MKTYISEKIELFRQGKITENSYFIEYDSVVHQVSYDLLYTYWSDELQYYVENFINETQVSAELSASSSDVFPVSGQDFELEDQYHDIDDIELITGIDFQSELGITESAFVTLTSNMDNIVNNNLSGMSTILSVVSGSIINNQILLNNNITLFEEQNIKTATYGMYNLMKIIGKYLDNYDTLQEYFYYYDIALTAGNVMDYIDNYEYNRLIDDILNEILNISNISIGKRIQDNTQTDSLYSKIDDVTLETEITKIIVLYGIPFDLSLRITKAVNNLMPNDQDIFDSTTQNEIFLTTESIIQEIDIYRNIAIEEGYIKP